MIETWYVVHCNTCGTQGLGSNISPGRARADGQRDGRTIRPGDKQPTDHCPRCSQTKESR